MPFRSCDGKGRNSFELLELEFRTCPTNYSSSEVPSKVSVLRLDSAASLNAQQVVSTKACPALRGRKVVRFVALSAISFPPCLLLAREMIRDPLRREFD